MLETRKDDDTPDEYADSLYTVRSPNSEPFMVTVQIQGKPVQMEIDTGATFSVMSESTFKSLWKGESAPPVRDSVAKLCTFTGESITVVGEVEVVQRPMSQDELSDRSGPWTKFVGRNWLKLIKLDWAHFHKLETTTHTHIVHITSSKRLAKITGIAICNSLPIVKPSLSDSAQTQHLMVVRDVHV